MSKNIVYCADGTWNGPNIPTNVYRLYKALKDSETQKCIYDEGVGREGTFINRLWGGAFGEGLIENVREGFDNIAKVYEEGDRIYLFGFSRGAYTARSLGGMIAYCGLPTGQRGTNVIDAAFAAYRGRNGQPKWTDRPAAAKLVDAEILMVGVWDTVGTLGIPGALFGRQDAKKYGFLDTTLHPDVRAGYHVLAVDEKRRQFTPTAWTGNPAEDQIIEQVWFAGVHGDVGGGLPMTKLSDITVAWMLSKAELHGVELDAAVLAGFPRLQLPAAAARDRMDSSWNLLWGAPKRRPVASDAAIANSVALRIAAEPRYNPRQLTIDENPRRLADSYKLEPVVQ